MKSERRMKLEAFEGVKQAFTRDDVMTASGEPP